MLFPKLNQGASLSIYGSCSYLRSYVLNLMSAYVVYQKQSHKELP